MTSFDRALVVDDLESSRDWLSRALSQAFPGIEISVAASLSEAQAHVDAPAPIALIDLGLPDGSGIQLIEQLQPQGTLCIVATVFDDDAHLFPALHAGAQGYVLKDQSTDTLVQMLTGIAAGQPPLSPSIARRLLRHFQPMAAASDEPALSTRETDVLRLIAKGHTVPEVAVLLGLSRHTAAGYLKDVYRKLSISSRAEAALAATRRGLVGFDG